MDEGRPAFVQYVFMDVVTFTQGRTVEAQAYIVRALNEVVTGALDNFDGSPQGAVADQVRKKSLMSGLSI